MKKKNPCNLIEQKTKNKPYVDILIFFSFFLVVWFGLLVIQFNYVEFFFFHWMGEALDMSTYSDGLNNFLWDREGNRD